MREVSPWQESTKSEFFDDLTGFPLDPALVRSARVLSRSVRGLHSTAARAMPQHTINRDVIIT